MKMKPLTQSYNDGLLSIYSVANDAEPGKLPTRTLQLKQTGIRYAERMVGLNRFWQSMRENVQVERVLRCPKVTGVARLGVVITEDGSQYQIEQVQYPPDIEPPSMDLTLSLVESHYDVADEPEAGDGDDG